MPLDPNPLVALMTTSSHPPEVEARSRFGSLLAAGLILATLCFLGVAVSAVLHSVAPKVFESNATVLIEPRTPLSPANPSFEFIYRHDQLIGEDNIITKALRMYDLKELATLRDLQSEDQILHIQNYFEAQPSEETDNVYHLRFQSRDAKDAQTVLATLVSMYERHLNERFRSAGSSSDVRELLLKMKNRFAKELTAKTEKIEQVEKQISTGQTSGDTSETLTELQEEVDRIQSKLDRALRRIAEHPKEKPRRGFNFETLSPASKGVSITPPLYVYLLIGGFVGATIGLIAARLMISVSSNSN